MKILSDTIQNPKYQAIYQRYNIDQSKYHPRQSIVGKVLLSNLLSVTLDQFLSQDLIKYGKKGKPSLKNSDFEYNITNSRDLVALAATDQEVGIDLEKKKDFNYRRIERAFSANEIDYLKGIAPEERSDYTLKLWTIKEAILKLNGLGIGGGLTSMQIDLDDLNHATRKGKKIRLSPLQIDSGYVGTIAQYE